jgi:hypothetical protein
LERNNMGRICLTDNARASVNAVFVSNPSAMDQLEEIVKLAAQPLPERVDGIVLVAKFTSADPAKNCRDTEADYERLARKNPATLFLRCFGEYENAELLFGQAQVTVFPTYDLFYRGAYIIRNDRVVLLCLDLDRCFICILNPSTFLSSPPRKPGGPRRRGQFTGGGGAAGAISVPELQAGPF